MPQQLTNQTSDLVSPSVPWAGGAATAFVEGVFDGAQLILECEKYGEFKAIQHNLTFNSPGTEDFTLAACNLRFRLINAGANTNINAGWDAI